MMRQAGIYDKAAGGLQEGDFYGKTWICNENKKRADERIQEKAWRNMAGADRISGQNEISNFSIWNAEDLILDIMKPG